MPIMGSLVRRITLYGALLALIVIACGVVIATYSTFGHTWDEPEHLAAGISLLDTGQYPYDAQHPPLARIAMGLGPYLAGAHSHGNTGPSGEEEGRDILYDEGRYDLYLTLARVGMLPFLALLLIATWFWSEHVYGRTAAILATALVASTPTLLGHAGVAALDIPMVATTLLALYLLYRWFEQPGFERAAGFGLAAGIAAGTKLSAIPFIGCAAIVWFGFACTAKPSRNVLLSRATLGNTALAAAMALIGLLICFAGNTETLLASFDALNEHNTEGHLSYFMGETRRTGWWNFYLVAIAVKTPLPLLVFGVAGLIWQSWRAWRARQWQLAAPALAFVAILVFCSAYSQINIGVRHVLILMPILALGAAELIVHLWSRHAHLAARTALCGVLAWQAIDLIRAHPDHLAYFNQLAGSHPERILVDSDLDWGQDLRRLEKELQTRDIREVSLVYRGTADMDREPLPAYKMLWPHQRGTGWIAVFLLAKATGDDGRGYTWLDDYQPVTRIGKSIDLYFIPPQATQQ